MLTLMHLVLIIDNRIYPLQLHCADNAIQLKKIGKGHRYVNLMTGQREWIFNKMSVWLLLGSHEELKKTNVLNCRLPILWPERTFYLINSRHF